MQIFKKVCTCKGKLQHISVQKNVLINERLLLFERCGGLSAFRAGGWREAKMGDFQGLAQWTEILAFAG
jgi:hypothetical protein